MGVAVDNVNNLGERRHMSLFTRYGRLTIIVPLLALITACSPAVTTAENQPAEVIQGAEPSDMDSANSNGVNGLSAASPEDTQVAEVSPNISREHAWTEPVIQGKFVSILLPVTMPENHVRFDVPATDGEAGFIGYFKGDEFMVRTVVCSNCGQEGIERELSILICQSCDATFELFADNLSAAGTEDQEGFVSNELFDNTVVMLLDDLLAAYNGSLAGQESLAEISEETRQDSGSSTARPPCCMRR